MHLLVFAPCAHAPWTEGRKNLVRDLCDEWRGEGHSVVLLAGSPSLPHFVSMVWCILGLAGRLLAFRPVRVFQFPFGTFGGTRGRINLVSSRLIRWMCSLGRLPLLTVLYSADGITLSDVAGLFGRAAACTSAPVKGLLPVHLGTRAPDARHASTIRSPRRFLFLCGYQSPANEVVRSVLQVRGLGVLLDACAALGGVSLTVAIPFLRHRRAREAIADEVSRRGLGAKVVLDGESAPVDLLLAHDAFVFPYIAEHALFVPTSLLEAMMVGIPVVATDRDMYRNLTRDGGIQRCALAADDSPEALARVMEGCIFDYERAVALAGETRDWVRAEWSIQETARQLLAISRYGS